jgi:hypothetical protein
MRKNQKTLHQPSLSINARKILGFCQLNDKSKNRLNAWGGSLILCLLTRDSIYVSADSRYANAPKEIKDSAQKLLTFGSSALCGLSGQLRFTRTEHEPQRMILTNERTFYLSDIIRGLDDNKVPTDVPNIVQLFAEHLFATLRPIWEYFASELDEPFGTHPDRPLPLAELLYVDRMRDGHPVLFSIILKHSLHYSDTKRYCSILHAPVILNRHNGYVDRPITFLQGMKYCACASRNPNVPNEAAARKLIDSIFPDAQRGRRCGAAIGGPIDLAVIDKAGRRWLQHKS